MRAFSIEIALCFDFHSATMTYFEAADIFLSVDCYFYNKPFCFIYRFYSLIKY